jgi:uncharacterized membrane protein YqjE
MADTAHIAPSGLFESLGVLASSVVAIIHMRLELFSTDLEEDQQHIFSLLVLALVALFMLGVGVVLATILLVVAFWDTHRLLVLGSLAGLYLLAGMMAAAFALHKARNKPRPFAASLSELLKERQQLVTRS